MARGGIRPSSWVGRGRPGPGRPKQNGAAHAPLQTTLLAEVEKKFEKELDVRKDVAAESAHAIFVGNADAIYKAFSKALLKGDPRVFQAANRAYGLPQQELGFAPEKPFKLVIEYIGEQSQEEITPAMIDGEELPQKSAQEPPAERLLRSSASTGKEQIGKSAKEWHV